MTGHKIYIQGIPELIKTIETELPKAIEEKMDLALSNCALIIRDGIWEKVAHHQHPDGIPPADVFGQWSHWFPPARKKHEFSHEYHGDPLESIPAGTITGYDFALQKRDQHYWPYNRLGELAGSLKAHKFKDSGTFGAMNFIVDTEYAADLEFMQGGTFSFLTPTLFEKSDLMFKQFVGAMMDVCQKFGSIAGTKRGR